MKIFKKPINPVSVILWSAVALAIVLVLLLALLPARKPDDIDDAAAPDLVRVLTMEPRNLVQSIILPGQALPNRTVMLAAELGGVLTEMAVDKGDAVKKGDVLARIDYRHWAAQHRQAEIEARDAERDLQRWQKMQAEGAVSQSAFDAVQRRQDLTAIALELAQIQLEKATLLAPADGIIDDRLHERGGYVNDGQAVFRFLEPYPMKVAFHVPERDVAMLRTGQTLNVRSQALAEAEPFTGKIIYVGQEATSPTFSYPVELIIDTPPEALRPGMIVQVEIDRAILDNALAVPLTAVIPRRGENVVFVYRDGIAERTVVWIDSMLNGEVVISSGLQPGDIVITSGHRTLQDGAPVEIVAEQE